MSSSSFSRAPSRVAAGVVVVLTACAAAAPVSVRVQVTTATEWADLAALQRALADAAGTSVRDVAGVGPRRFALTLDCADTAACEAARARLQASSLVTEVADDRRERLPPSPRPPLSR